MKNEMDVMGLGDFQRIAWLRASRITLFAVGVVWLGMIVRDFSSGNLPWFLIVMVPVFALLRFVCYSYYRSAGRSKRANAS